MLSGIGGVSVGIAGRWGGVGGTVGSWIVWHTIIVVIIIGVSGRGGRGVGWWGVGMNSWGGKRAVSTFCRAASGVCGGI